MTKNTKTGAIFKISFAFVFILFLALFIRLKDVSSLPVFADEAIYIRWAQVMRSEATLRFLPLSDGKQPLFMWSLVPFLKLFNDPLLAGRMVSVITGLGTVAGIFLAAYILFSSFAISLISSLIYAISPFSVFFDRLALVDSMLCMFGVWVFALSALTAKKQRFDFAMLTGIMLGFAALTKSNAIYFALFIPFVSVFLPKVGKKERVKLLAKNLFFLLTIYVFAFGMYNILRLGPDFGMLAARSKDYVYPLRHVFQSPLDPLKGHLGGIWDYFVKIGPGILVILILWGSYILFGNNRKNFFILAVWGFVPILITAEYAKVVTARYIVSSLPFIFILASVFWIEKKVRRVGLVIFGLFIIQSLYVDRLIVSNIYSAPLPQGERSGYLEEWTSGVGIKDVADYIKAKKKEFPDKTIVVGTEGYFGTLPDGLQIYLNNTPGVIVIGVGLGFDTIPKSLVESHDFGNPTYLVINSSRLTLKEEEKQKLSLIATYPKGLRKVGSREYKMYGPQDSLLLLKY